MQGHLRQAVEISRDALRHIEQVEPNPVLIAAHSYAETILGWSLYEANDLQGTERHVTQAITLARLGRSEQHEAVGYRLLALVREAQGRGIEALELLDRAEMSARRREMPDEILLYGAQRARLARMHGDLETLARWAREYCPSVDQHDVQGGLADFLEEFADCSYIRALLSLGRVDEAALLVARLREWAELSGRSRSTIELCILEGLALQAHGNLAAARESIEHALTLAEPEGYVRVFADEGKPVAELLLACRRQFSTVSPTYIQELLDVLGNQKGVPSPGTPQTLIEPLTARELDVLRLLAMGVPNREIADHLVVTVGTVKRHTGNIYGKLGVDNRTQAILRAQELGLL
jgi:LuxR family maltose regulon positive regulatory protein